MFDTFVNIFECILVTLFLYFGVNERKQNAILYSIIYTLFDFAFIQFINQYSVTAGLLFVIEVAYTFVYVNLISYKEKPFNLMLSIIPFVVFAVSNIPILLTISRLLFRDINYYKMLSLYQIPIVCFLQMLHVIILYFVCRLLRNKDLSFTSKDYFSISGILCVCMIVSVCFEAIMLKKDNDDMYLLLGMYSVVIICGLLIHFFSSYHQRILNENRQKNELMILRSQISSNQRTIEIQKELYQMKHDIKHFLQTAKSFDSMDEAVQQQIDSFSTRFDNLSIPVRTVIPALNHTLNIARDEAKAKGIDFVCNLNITKPLNIDENDLYLLFSNLFDNAIRHIGIQKKIDVYAKNTEDIFAIKISNSVVKQIIDDKKSVITSKDGIEHGYGITTIETIIHKYNGTISYSQNNDCFSVTISIPFPPI